MSAWSYYSWVVKVPSIYSLDVAMNGLGAEGWELVTSVTTVKTWVNLSGNDLVFVFKKPGVGQTPSNALLIQLTGNDPDMAY